MRLQGFNLLPPVVKNLLIINGLMFLITLVLKNLGIDLDEHLALYYFKSEFFRPWQIISHMFMHGSFSHLFFNMFAIWMFGNTLENHWGSKRFLVFYMFTGLGSAILYTAVQHLEIIQITSSLNPELVQRVFDLDLSGISIKYQPLLDIAHIPALGASGALFGILMAYGMTYPNAKILIYLLFPVKVKYLVLVYGLVELFSGISGYNPGVAHFAHLGGMLFGFLLIKYWRKTNNYFY